MVHIMFCPITWAPISGRQITNQFGGLCQGCDEATLPEVGFSQLTVYQIIKTKLYVFFQYLWVLFLNCRLKPV